MPSSTVMWWLHNTAAGRRELERLLPTASIPMPVRRQMCDERGHKFMGAGDCVRCGAPRPGKEQR
jgi:hypothetical protein